MRRITLSLAIAIGAQAVHIGPRLLDNKFKQFVGLFNLRNRAEELRAMAPLKEYTVVLTDRYKFDQKRKRLYLPFNFEMSKLKAFLLHELKRRQSEKRDL